MKPGRDFFRWLTPSRLSLCINLPLALSGLPFGSFDAYTHIFFADHYRRNWFDLVEPRWFGGFSVASYPPLVHQLIAVISRPISAFASLGGGTPAEVRLSGEAAAYCLVLVAVLACLPIAMESFASIFVPARAARTAAWLSVALPSVYLTAYAFGQLPTLAATAALLWAIGQGWAYIHRGNASDLLMAVLWAGVTAALHHAVLLFAAVLGLAFIGKLLLENTNPLRKRFETAARWGRAALAAGTSAVAGAVVVWPFLAWSGSYTPQVPIDHLSRHNVLTEFLAGYYFLWPMYGAVAFVLLLFARKVILSATLRWVPLLAAAILLFVLGLGGTTPLPALLFGANWQWLTYDRFSLWSGLAMLPIAGLAWHILRPRRKLAMVAVQVGFCLYGAMAAVWTMAQPPALDVARIARWLDDHTRGGERYLTLGFGDQLAKLSVLTEGRTIDGTYFTARQLPELRQSGIGTIDGVKWSLNNVWQARPFLVRSRGWGVRWVLSAWPAFDPVLRSSGYQLWGAVAPGVRLWRNSAAWVSTEFRATVQTDPAATTWWGLAPMMAFILASVAAFWKYHSRYWVSVCVGLLIVLWPFWYYVPLWTTAHPGVYFTYTAGLLFAVDVIAVLLVLGVVASKRHRIALAVSKPGLLAIGALLIFAALSIPASADPALSLAFVMHLAAILILGWIVMQVAPDVSWRTLAIALTVALVIQSTSGLLEAAAQSTGWLESLGLKWPGVLSAETRGASVVELANGFRWLRAYGTLPHPNTLGTFLVGCLAGPLLGYLHTGRARWLIPLVVGTVAVFLTFSRGAWLGYAAVWIAAFLSSPVALRRRVGAGALSAGTTLLVLTIAVYPLVISRISATSDSDREVSSTIERLGLAQVALDFIRSRPITGVGAGAFTVAMAANAPLAEPVHNVPLLAAAETGWGGGAAVAALCALIVLRAWRRRGLDPRESILAAVVLGSLVIGQFDHVFWSLSEGRLWAALLIGLWLGAGRTEP